MVEKLQPFLLSYRLKLSFAVRVLFLLFLHLCWLVFIDLGRQRHLGRRKYASSLC